MATARLRSWKRHGETKSAWVVNWTDGDRKRRTKTCRSEAEAKALCRKVQKNPRALDKQMPFTVREMCRRYLVIAEDRHRDGDRMGRARLVALWNSVDRHILPFLGTLPAAALTPLVIDEWVQKLKHHPTCPRSAEVIRGAVGVLRGALTEAQRLELITRNVVKDVPPRVPPVKHRPVEVPTKADVQRIVDKCTGEIGIVVRIAFLTGLRAGEIAALRWECIDFDKRTIRVERSIDGYGKIKEPKTKAGTREVPIAAALAVQLREWRVRSASRSEWLFPQRLTTVDRRAAWALRQPLKSRPKIATRLTARYFQAQIDIGMIGQDGKHLYRFHALRHVAASLFIEQGLPPKRIQQIMGHATIAMTFDRYGHLFDDGGAGAAAASAISEQFRI